VKESQTSANLRATLISTTKSCKVICKKLESLKPNVQQERNCQFTTWQSPPRITECSWSHFANADPVLVCSLLVSRSVLFFWTGYHGHEGLNLRHGACMLTPSSVRAGAASPSSSSSSSPSSLASVDSLHNDRCNLLYVNGAGSYAALPKMLLRGAATISVYVKIHSFTPDAMLARLARDKLRRGHSIVLGYSEQGFMLTAFRDEDQEAKVRTKPECVKQGQWQHVLAMVEQ
jgi:hypothetical protein